MSSSVPTRVADRVCDVLVIGGGPAGSTIAALLADRGRDVVLLEKAVHPRFHIGESLLPANAGLFDRLGVREAVEAIGMRKWGVEFVDGEDTGRPAERRVVEFVDGWTDAMPYAWQVRRSTFDELLFRHAGRRGARTAEGCRARRVIFDPDGADVEVQDEASGERRALRARYVVDATGRDTLLAGQLGSKRRHRRHASAAVYGHFRGARRLEGRQEGHISLFWFDQGWCWFIPLADGATSVGAVCSPAWLKTRQGRSLDAFLLDTLARCPELASRLDDAELVEGSADATGNYSYASHVSSGPRFLLLGDAYAFIDPVFSSGVYFAMQSAFDGVDVVEATLDGSRAVARRARRRFDRRIRFGPRQFSWFIERATHPTLRRFFLSADAPGRIKPAMLSLLAGDIHGTTPIWPAIRLVKLLYHVVSIGRLRPSWEAWRRRRERLRGTGGLST